MSDIKRSTFQKLKEESKVMLNDLDILTRQYDITDSTFFIKKMDVLKKWRNHFNQEREFNALLKQASVQYLKDHPEFDIRNPRFCHACNMIKNGVKSRKSLKHTCNKKL